MSYKIDSDENSDYIYDTIAKFAYPRAPCSVDERKAAEGVKEILEKQCDEVVIEEFTCYPKAFLGWIRLVLGCVALSFLLFLLTDIHILTLALSIVCSL